MNAQSGVGLFWGDATSIPEPATGRLPLLLPQPSTPHQRTPVRERYASSVRKSISLPDLETASNAQLVVPFETGSISVHDSSRSLLSVLQTLWKSIARETYTFVQQINSAKERSVADHKCLQTPYYTSVYHEDTQYFLRERQAELQRETMRKQTKAYRELHCAADDRQQYVFDRRRRRSRANTTARPIDKGAEKEIVENQLIDRHDHKIQHLLHVLQTEMANETQREIRALNHWGFQKPLSRQSRRQISTIVKERYEAADRIMRILEDYHIVIGADAAKYLQDTIALGSAMESDTQRLS